MVAVSDLFSYKITCVFFELGQVDDSLKQSLKCASEVTSILLSHLTGRTL